MDYDTARDLHDRLYRAQFEHERTVAQANGIIAQLVAAIRERDVLIERWRGEANVLVERLQRVCTPEQLRKLGEPAGVPEAPPKVLS